MENEKRLRIGVIQHLEVDRGRAVKGDWALGSLGPAARLSEPALPSSSLGLTPKSGFTCQWVGNSQSLLDSDFTQTWASTSPWALSGSTMSYLMTGPTKQQPAGSAQDRAWKPLRRGANQTYQTIHIACHNRETHVASWGKPLEPGWWEGRAPLGCVGRVPEKAASPGSRNRTKCPHT